MAFRNVKKPGVSVMRRSPCRGRDKTHLQHVATAGAINLLRTVHWLRGGLKAETRIFSFRCTRSLILNMPTASEIWRFTFEALANDGRNCYHVLANDGRRCFSKAF
jgi:hypothetical protein